MNARRQRDSRQVDTNSIECLRVLQHRGRDLAEIQRLAGRAAIPITTIDTITPEARLSQDGILGCDIETQGRSDRHVVAIRVLDDVLEDGFLVRRLVVGRR